MQIKTTRRYHLTPSGMVIINKSVNKCRQRCRERDTLVHCWQEWRLLQPGWKTIWSFLKKLKMELSFDPAIPLLGIYPKNHETPVRKNICMSIFLAVFFTIAQLPISSQGDKKGVVHLQMECNMARKRRNS